MDCSTVSAFATVIDFDLDCGGEICGYSCDGEGEDAQAAGDEDDQGDNDREPAGE
jgi:hypothetical protein